MPLDVVEARDKLKRELVDCVLQLGQSVAHFASTCWGVRSCFAFFDGCMLLNGTVGPADYEYDLQRPQLHFSKERTATCDRLSNNPPMDYEMDINSVKVVSFIRARATADGGTL